MFGCCGVGRRQRYYYLFSFERILVYGPTACLRNSGGIRRLPCIQTFIVRQRVIGEPPNLTHNLALKRAAIGQLTGDIGSCPGGRSFGGCADASSERPPAVIRGPSLTLPSGETYWIWITIGWMSVGIRRVSSPCPRLEESVSDPQIC